MSRLISLSDIPSRLSSDAFWHLVGHREHESLDFKRGVPEDILTTIPAMAMTDGGLIIHGVRDDRTISGCPLSQNTADRITRFANECGVQVQFAEVAVDDAKVTITAVPAIRERIVTTPDGRLLRRVGGDSLPLRGDAMARFVVERSGMPAESEAIAVFRAEDFDLDRVNVALAADGRAPVRTEDLRRGLVDLGVALPAAPPLDPLVLKAAAVLFARDPTTFIPRAAVQLVRRVGVDPAPGPVADRTECAGPLVDVLECCLAFVRRHTARHEIVRGTYRENWPEYPDAVIREAVLNALAHRDYGLAGATVDLTIWDDRLEVSSPGGLPAPITVENIRDEHCSRNPRLMRVLKTMGLVEEYGDGVDRMFREMETRLLEPPHFAVTPASVTVTLRNRILVGVDDQVWLSLLGPRSMTAPERLILVTARNEGHVTPRRARTLLADTPADIPAGDTLSGMVAKGLLRRTGRAGGTRYVLSDEVLQQAGSNVLRAEGQRRDLLLNAMRDAGSLSTTEGAEALGGSLVAARQLLNELVQAGLARAEGRTRGRRYYPT